MPRASRCLPRQTQVCLVCLRLSQRSLSVLSGVAPVFLDAIRYAYAVSLEDAQRRLADEMTRAHAIDKAHTPAPLLLLLLRRLL